MPRRPTTNKTKRTSVKKTALPSVSFVATFYNKAPYIPTVLASIKAQRGLGATEYIFVDDGSTDSSLAVLKKLTRGWPNCHVITQPNGGQTAANITGLQRAKHEFIKLWDGDDYAHPGLTAHLIHACEKLDADYAFCDVVFGEHPVGTPWATLAKWTVRHPLPTPRLLPQALARVLRTPVTNPSGTVLRRSLLQKMGLPDARIVIPDVYMSYTAALYGKIAELPTPMAYAFKAVPGRLTHNQAQIRHDINGAMACFYANQHHVLPYKVRRLIYRRVVGRAWLWARRHLGMSVFSPWAWYQLWARLNPFTPAPNGLFKYCQPFRQPPFKVRVSANLPLA